MPISTVIKTVILNFDLPLDPYKGYIQAPSYTGLPHDHIHENIMNLMHHCIYRK